MNKIKTIYDAVTKIKDKNSIKGTLIAKGLKNKEKLFEIDREFEKNDQGFKTKGKTTVEADCDGEKMKMEKNIDFQMKGFHRHHGGIRHMHSFHAPHRKPLTFKEELIRLSALLGILISINVDKMEDGLTKLSLKSDDISEDIKNDIIAKMGHRWGGHHHMHTDHHMFMKEFHSMENVDFTINMLVNKESDIVKITVDLNGKQKSERDDEIHNMKLEAEISFE